jgi:hypothetical protein
MTNINGRQGGAGWMRLTVLCCCVWAWVLGAAESHAMEIKLHAQLIWGTNDEKPARDECKEVSGRLREKLARVFKWKNYFLIKDETFTVKPGEERRVKMSDKCTLEFTLVDDFTLEVQLFGEGTLLKTVRQPIRALRQGEMAVLAGDAKDKLGDAWFVVLTMPRK